MQRKFPAILTAAISGLCTSTAAAEASAAPVLVPASFNDGGRSLQNRISFPRVKGDVSVSILCGARLDQSGEILDNYCWNLTDDRMGFVKAINRVTDQVRLTPATVDGVTAPVWFQYSIEFRKLGEEEQIAVFPNWGFNREQYGIDYIGPQLYDAPRRSMTCTVNQSFMVSMNIGADGTITDPEIISGEPTDECRRRFLNFVPSASYIPAHADGQPVATMCVDFWFNSVPRWTGRRRWN